MIRFSYPLPQSYCHCIFASLLNTFTVISLQSFSSSNTSDVSCSSDGACCSHSPSRNSRYSISIFIRVLANRFRLLYGSLMNEVSKNTYREVPALSLYRDLQFLNISLLFRAGINFIDFTRIFLVYTIHLYFHPFIVMFIVLHCTNKILHGSVGVI